VCGGIVPLPLGGVKVPHLLGGGPADPARTGKREAYPNGKEAPTLPSTPIAPLSQREWEVLTLLAQGYNLTRIAEALHIQPVTTRNYIQRVLHKLGVHSRTEAIAWLYRRHREMAS